MYLFYIRESCQFLSESAQKLVSNSESDQIWWGIVKYCTHTYIGTVGDFFEKFKDQGYITKVAAEGKQLNIQIVCEEDRLVHSCQLPHSQCWLHFWILSMTCLVWMIVHLVIPEVLPFNLANVNSRVHRGLYTPPCIPRGVHTDSKQSEQIFSSHFTCVNVLGVCTESE